MSVRAIALVSATGLVAALAFGPGLSASAQGGNGRPAAFSPAAGWERQVEEALPALGHRNWIVVADSAYPQQISPGVKTITTGEHQLSVVRRVAALLNAQPHVRAHIQVDKELSYVPEKSAPGISRYRKSLDEVLAGQRPTPVLHEDLIGRLDKAGEKFSVIVLKTDLTLPYTSVFFELDAKYWDADRESELRKLMHG